MSTLQQKFKSFTAQNYGGQAKAFLNAFWQEREGEAERVWDVYNIFVEIDFENKKEGCDLDEFGAHRVLEKFGETRSVKAMRDELRAVDMDFNKRVALIEYLLFTFGHTVEDFVARPQGSSDELVAAQKAVEAAQAALQEAVDALDASNAAADEARQKAEVAQAAADESNAKAADAAAAEKELKDALDSLHAQEEAFEHQKETLKSKSLDQSVGVVTRNKAANELAQLEATDPLPLRQAKIDTGAATRKAEKARIAAEESATQANAAAAEADESRAQAEAAAEEARNSADAMESKFTEAENQLQILGGSGGGSGQGAIWWLERELQEAKKYAPRRR
jgi:chemotaxis protein histidine kinase CheA